MAEGVGGNKKVMVAVDESECSRYALEWVLDNLCDCIALPLLVFTAQLVTDLNYIYAATFDGLPPPELIESVQERQNIVASALLKRADSLCASREVVAEMISEVGDPKRAICDAAEKYKVGILVVGNHGRGILERAFLGSVSNYCVHNAKCPVLVVKKPV